LSNSGNIKNKWQSDFLLSPVAIQEKQTINHIIAHQLCYEKVSDSSSNSCCGNYQAFVPHYRENSNEHTASEIYNSLFFIEAGITGQVYTASSLVKLLKESF
jgi:hypothetical protein